MQHNKALEYHASFPQGKIQIMPTKRLKDPTDLALAYTPGIATPCQEIAKDIQKAYTYTGKGNLVAICTNGTAVLGLKNIGPVAAKPVMEGKALLFKMLAGIDAFDLEIQEEDPDKLVSIINALTPTFGGINLEDIQAPQCFDIEQNLQKISNIPVMHDDQHATAIVVSAALHNALRLVNKKIKNIRTVIYGAGASAIATASLLCKQGLPKSNLIMFDSQGAIHKQRSNLSKAKTPFATDKPISLVDAMYGADFFLGLSVGNILHPDHLQYMAPNPIIFALANPTPEIDYNLAHQTRKDLIMGTGRSDYPNQINNVLAFPYIFRGLLDVQATQLNDEIKLAVAHAIASLVDEKEMSTKNGLQKKCLIPHALDKRLYTKVSTIVAQTAIKTKVAKNNIQNWKDYAIYLQQRIKLTYES